MGYTNIANITREKAELNNKIEELDKREESADLDGTQTLPIYQT